MALLVRLAQHGVIHGDFNEFNLMIDDHERITLIDFPQMVSVDHINAQEYFDRDVNCIRTLFERRYGYVATEWPTLHSAATRRTHALDKEVAASGFTRELQSTFEELLQEQQLQEQGEEEEGEEEEEEVGEAVDMTRTGRNDAKEEMEAMKEESEEELEEEEDAAGAEEELEETLERNANKSGVRITARLPPSTSLSISTSTASGTKTKDRTTEDEDKDKEEDSEAARLAELARRQHIQKRVKQKLAHAERRKRGNKNIVKSRDRRALHAEARSQGEFW